MGPHRWKTTTSRPGEGEVVRARYLTCRRCGLRVKTEERLAVPWSEADLVPQVKALLPEGKAVALRDKGVMELPLARLTAQLASRGYVIRATKEHDTRRLVVCVNEDGQVERYGLFELRRIPQPDHDASTKGGEGETAPRTAPSWADTR